MVHRSTNSFHFVSTPAPARPADGLTQLLRGELGYPTMGGQIGWGSVYGLYPCFGAAGRVGVSCCGPAAVVGRGS